MELPASADAMLQQSQASISGALFFRFTSLTFILLVSLGVNLCLGDVFVDPEQAATVLFNPQPHADSPVHNIIWQVRLPRLLIAMTVGAALAVSGYILQALSKNDLADPYLTGVSSGAGLAAALSMVLGLDFSLLPTAAFAGGLAASLLVALMSRTASGLSVTRLILSGVALSAVCGSLITLVLVTGGNPALSQGLFFWLSGAIAGRDWSELTLASVYVLGGMLLAFLMTKPMRLLSLGPATAASLGLNVGRTQLTLLVAAVLLCAASVSISGLVGFVGLIAPHFTRRLFGRDERAHLLACAMAGAILVLLSDLCARTLGQGQELPLGTLLALIGGPFFLFLVVHQHSEGL